jgi:imidazole glycerol-phosphate synthase subunit HisH
MPDPLSPGSEAPIPVAFAATGVANLASIMAAFRRAGAAPFLAARAQDIASAPFAVVPGVGSFGSAMAALSASGMDLAVKDRLTRGKPTMGVCAGMQLFFEGSEESPGVRGMSLLPGRFKRFPSDLPVPQLGWNVVRPQNEALVREHELVHERELVREHELFHERELVHEGWAYFANSYRLSEAPEGLRASWAEYGEAFVAALEGDGNATRTRGERPSLLLCQFHPELSGPWGLELIRAWLGSPEAREGASS